MSNYVSGIILEKYVGIYMHTCIYTGIYTQILLGGIIVQVYYS